MRMIIATIKRRAKKIFQYANKQLYKYIEIIFDGLNFNKNNYYRQINETQFQFIITHDLGGGSDLYLKDKLQNLKKPYLIMISHPAGFRIQFFNNNHKFKFLVRSLKQFEANIDCRNILTIFLNNYVRGRKPLELLEFLCDLKDRYQLSLTIPIHDFFAICPSYALINDRNKYCGIPDNINTCEACKKTNAYNQYKSISIVTWRNAWEKSLTKADEVICFSNNSSQLLSKVYPGLKEKIKIIPHQVQKHGTVIPAKVNASLHIGVVGNISSIHKGVVIIKEMLNYINKNNLNIHITIIGSAFQLRDAANLTITGPYQRSQLREIIQNTNINLFFLPSIWPETFSYITHELIQLNVAIAVFNLGAQAEAIANYQKGCLIPEINAKSALQTLIQFHQNLLLKIE